MSTQSMQPGVRCNQFTHVKPAWHPLLIVATKQVVLVWQRVGVSQWLIQHGPFVLCHFPVCCWALLITLIVRIQSCSMPFESRAGWDVIPPKHLVFQLRSLLCIFSSPGSAFQPPLVGNFFIFQGRRQGLRLITLAEKVRLEVSVLRQQQTREYCWCA